MANDDSRAWKDQYMLRLPDGMRDRIKAAAAENNRSMNAEIVDALEATYPHVESGLDERLSQLDKLESREELELLIRELSEERWKVFKALDEVHKGVVKAQNARSKMKILAAYDGVRNFLRGSSS